MLTSLINIFVFAFGAIVGSFLNVVVGRYGTGDSFLKGRSKCPNCGKVLNWHELIPIFSFILQKRKCKGCGDKISWQYPLIELATGSLFLAVFSSLISNYLLVFDYYSLLVVGYWLLVTCFLILIFVYDFHTQIIPNEFVYPFIALSFFSFWILDFEFVSGFGFQISDFLPNFLTGITFFLFFGALWLFSGGKAMGFGDAKLVIGIGWLLGPYNGTLAILLSFWIGAIVGIALLFFNKKKYNIKSKVAFGPFLAVGTMIAFLFGDSIIKFWLTI